METKFNKETAELFARHLDDDSLHLECIACDADELISCVIKLANSQLDRRAFNTVFAEAIMLISNLSGEIREKACNIAARQDEFEMKMGILVHQEGIKRQMEKADSVNLDEIPF